MRLESIFNRKSNNVSKVHSFTLKLVEIFKQMKEQIDSESGDFSLEVLKQIIKLANQLSNINELNAEFKDSK